MAAELLAAARPDQAFASSVPEIVFLFPGGGTQHAHMGAALYQRSGFFCAEVDNCCKWLREHSGIDLFPLLFPADDNSTAANLALSRIEIAQPALFVIEYAMAKWWMKCGVKPALMLGHSLGEYVAACLAGVFSLEDALRIVVERGRLLQSLDDGAMTAIPLSAQRLTHYLAEGGDLAATNGRDISVVAGPQAVIEKIEARARKEGHIPRRLHVSIASHSAMVEPIMAQLENLIASVQRHAPVLPFISNVTGVLITAEQAVNPAYWSSHLRSTVRFADGLKEIFRIPDRVILEVGPGETLSGLARQYTGYSMPSRIWASQAHPQQHHRNEQQLMQTVAGLWSAGVDMDWNEITPRVQARKVSLPTYAFQRQRYWINAGAKNPSAKTTQPSAQDAGFHYVPTWQRTLSPAVPTQGAGAILVLGNDDNLTTQIVASLRALRKTVILVQRGSHYQQLRAELFVIRSEMADMERVLRSVESETRVTHLVHLWSIDSNSNGDDAGLSDILGAGYFSLLEMAKALDATDHRQLSILVATNQVEDVTGLEPLSPEKATVLGIARVWGQEYPELRCRVVDVVPPAPASSDEVLLARQLTHETLSGDREHVLAYRGTHRWIKAYEPVPMQLPKTQRLRRDGVYLITGGLGGVGLALARYLGRQWQARLVLLGRSILPPRCEWASVIADVQTPANLRRKLVQLSALEDDGIKVLILAADVTDRDQMDMAIAEACAHFGAINGVIHAVVHPERGMIAHRSRTQVEAAFAPKIAGTRVLLQCLQTQSLDFVLLCSSVASVIGGLARSDYAAANAFLDAFAIAWHRKAHVPIFSVNWDAWRDVGIATDMDVPEGIGLDEQRGVRAFERVVNGAMLPQVVVAASTLEQRMNALELDVLGLLDNVDQQAPLPTNHARPVLANAYVTPTGELEEMLASLWSQMLGISPIGVRDNMFELGGDSLLAVRMLAQVRKRYGVELSPAAFFRNPTIADLAIDVETRLIEEIELEDGRPAAVEAV